MSIGGELFWGSPPPLEPTMQFESYVKLKNRSLKLKTEIIMTWSTWIHDRAAAEDEDLDHTLAYLWPAVLKGQKVKVTHDSSIVFLLRHFGVPENEKIWDYLDIDAE